MERNDGPSWVSVHLNSELKMKAGTLYVLTHVWMHVSVTYQRVRQALIPEEKEV